MCVTHTGTNFVNMIPVTFTFDSPNQSWTMSEKKYFIHRGDTDQSSTNDLGDPLGEVTHIYKSLAGQSYFQNCSVIHSVIAHVRGW